MNDADLSRIEQKLDRILTLLEKPEPDREAELNKAVKMILNGDKAGGQRIINSRRTKA